MITLENIIFLITQEENSDAEEILQKLATKYFNYKIHKFRTGIDAIQYSKSLKPSLIIVDDNLADISGSSVSSIIKGSMLGLKQNVIVYNIAKVMPNSKADCTFVKPLDHDVFISEIEKFIEHRNIILTNIEVLNNAKDNQKNVIPETIKYPHFEIENIFCPYSDFSGDGLDYWYGENQNGLYGFLFDCVGHDISSYLQTSEIRASLRSDFKMFQIGYYKTVSDILFNVNNNLFTLHNDDPSPTAVVVFYIDFNKNVMYYSTAGIPMILVRFIGDDQYRGLKMANCSLGYEPDIQFDMNTVELANVKDIVFSSDGFTDLLMHNGKKTTNINSAKHDDISAILIHFTKKMEEKV